MHREVTQQGWFSRLGGAFKGLLAGLVLLVVSVGLQFWNEGRTMKRDAALGEGRATVQAVENAQPRPALDGRLVHVSGDAVATAPVVDEEFGVDLAALALRRRVEMYQWHERREKKEEKQLGGGTRTVTEYRYEQRWADEAIDSSEFAQPAGHANPGAMPYSSQTHRAEAVRLGGFGLASGVAAQIGGWRDVAPSQVTLPPNLAASFRTAGEWFTTSADPARPALGDVRVRFEMVPAGMVSVVARQQGEMLVPHATGTGEELLLVERGRLDAGAMFDAEGSRNSTLGWILRLAGFVLAWIGFNLLLRPLVVLADVVPLFGRLAGFGTALLAGVLALFTSLLGIGGGWLWHRPWLLGLALLGIAAVVAWLLRARRPAQVAPPPPAMPPPPPPAA